ncbi:hypothetical protein PC112_g24400, partial [Phytophthora cactorum]
MPRVFHGQHLQSVLLMLNERDNSRRQELQEYTRVLEENESTTLQCPIYDSFVVDGGADAIVRLTNVTPRENGGTWEMLSNIFHVKTATFIKTTTSFIRVIAPRIYDDWV